MRLRNIPRAEGVLSASPFVVKQSETFRGTWSLDIFGNSNPLHIEIGMGKGQFLIELARRNPQINYVGIERYSSVLLRAVEKLEGEISKDASFENLRFICIDATDIPQYFSEQEVQKIYLNFSDPWPKARHARRRLTSAQFFARYDQILAKGGRIEFKTDNRGLFDFSVEELANSERFLMTHCTYDLHHTPEMNEGNIMTEYEQKFSSMNHPICKLIAARREDL